MFLFRWIFNLLGIIGWILFVLIGYSAAFPLAIYSPSRLDLESLLACDRTILDTNVTRLSTEDKFKLRSEFQLSNPADIADQLLIGMEQVGKPLDISPILNTSYCEVDTDKDKTIESVKTYLNGRDKNYSYGSITDFINTVNQIPFVQLSLNYEEKGNNILVRSDTCNRPIHKSDFYLISVETVNTKTYVVMFEINLKQNETTKEKELARNILDSGHFIKTKLYCNGQ